MFFHTCFLKYISGTSPKICNCYSFRRCFLKYKYILGKEFGIGKRASIMPYGAFRAMYVTRPTFDESGLERLEVEGNDAWSAKPRAGVEIKGEAPIGKAWKVKGTLDLAYEYELADLNEREKARLIAIEDGYHKLSKPEDEKGTFRTKASIGVEVEDKYGIYVTGEYLTGEDKENDYRAGVSLKAVF
jgi:outer membrane autotransporter protein